MKDFKQHLLNLIDNNSYISSCLQFLHIRDNRELKAKNRTIYINNVKPDDYNGEQVPLKYCSNSIKTYKYTLWNFLPKNLFEQFRRIANFYFLVNLIIIFSVPDPPTSPYTSMIPLLFVVIVTAVKQGYEDILRHKSDRQLNNLPVRILRNGKFGDFKWRDIKCGDIVECLADQSFPCDMVLLYAKTETDQCHITTANLDGETNLKVKSVPAKLKVPETESELANFRGVIECEKPNLHLYEFSGKITVNGQQYAIINDNILLRGACLRIAPLIYGCAIYTGKDTKMMKNSKFKSNKLSCIERRLNRFIFVFLIILAVITFTCFGCSFIFSDIYSNHWYISGREPQFYKTNRNLANFITLVLYMNLFNYIVPLSMYVTVELQRFVGSKFINWDIELYDPKTDQPAKANTSDLNEDLGQVEYLFSDKTGTLTENEMEFRQFSIDGIIYEEKNGLVYKLGSSDSDDQLMSTEKFIKFFEILALCHTVQVDNSAKEKYQASSPDEYSFIKYCIRLGIVYEGEEKVKNSSVLIRTVNFRNRKMQYEVMDVFEFDSTRKRMSVILREMHTGKLVMYCKGAESHVFKKCTRGNVPACDDDIKRFAEQGWRTLALSFKYLTESDYKTVKEKLETAYNDILNRNENLAKVFDEVESDLELAGATAVEDKLQEDVADTLETLRRSGIKVWVLTGDKRETAINISYSCKHFSKDMVKLVITDVADAQGIRNRLDYFEQQIKKEPKVQYALIIDGFTLGILFKNRFDQIFRDVCMQCKAVLCCRMSPAQKAEVVKLVKKSKKKPMCAAIGDGANDVSMIQEAHVGLGIFGKEGRNAARSSDFAFAKFKFVRRILLAHGFLYYTRAANLVQYFFYKNLAFSICQFYFAFFNAFSVSSLYDSVVLTLYNVVFTAAPILLFGLFEQKIAIKKLEKNPYVYRTIKNNRILRSVEFLKWNFLGIWHSSVTFFFGYALFASGTPLSSNGKLSGSYQFGVFVFTSTVLVVHLKLLIEWQYKSLFLLLGYGMSLLSYIVFGLVVNSIIIPRAMEDITDGQSLYWEYYNMFSHGPMWFCFLLIAITSLIPDIVIKVVENLRDSELVRKEKLEEAKRMKNIVELRAHENTGFDNLEDTVPKYVGEKHQDKTEPNEKDLRIFYVSNKNSNTKVLQSKLTRSGKISPGETGSVHDSASIPLDELN